jgi:hypothetical protein
MYQTEDLMQGLLTATTCLIGCDKLALPCNSGKDTFQMPFEKVSDADSNYSSRNAAHVYSMFTMMGAG